MKITSDLQDMVSQIADERLPVNWGATVKPKRCRHGLQLKLHVNTPQGNELAQTLRRGALKVTRVKVAMVIDELTSRLYESESL
jgi:phage head maturation protease